MFCVKCGHEIPEDSNFCLACGSKIPLSQVISDNVINRSTINQIGTQIVGHSSVKCNNCLGSGKCINCSGLGWVYSEGLKSPVYGFGKATCIPMGRYSEDDILAIGCYGTGGCLYCLGTGLRDKSMLDPDGFYKSSCKCGNPIHKEGYELIGDKLEKPSMTDPDIIWPAQEFIPCMECTEEISLDDANWKKTSSTEYFRYQLTKSSKFYGKDIIKCSKCGTDYVPILEDKYCSSCSFQEQLSNS